MTDSSVARRAGLMADRWTGPAVAAAASLLLSLWAIYLDPVLDGIGVADVLGAGLFSDTRWLAGLDAAGRPFHSLAVAALSGLTGLSVLHAAYVLGALFLAGLAAGFMVLVRALDGGRTAQWLAAGVVLLWPALNGFRAGVSGDAAYWACYVWSLACFMHYAATSDRRSLAKWALATVAAMLFGGEALVFLLVIPLWLCVRRPGTPWPRAMKTLAVLLGMGVVVIYGLWHHAWQAEATAARVLLHPVAAIMESWESLGQAIRFKQEALRGEFLDGFSQGYDTAALLVSLAVLSVAAVVHALGFVYAALAAYGLAVVKRVAAGPAGYWWAVFALLSLALVMSRALAGFEVERRDAMTAALTLLAIVPPVLERFRQAWRDGAGHRRWAWPAGLVLIAAAGLHGLDPRTSSHHLREAGLWLGATTAPDGSLYSNSPVVAYYSGMNASTPRGGHAWREAMNIVHDQKWRDYDYLALQIDRENRHREGILLRSLDAEPVRTFSNDEGDRVLIFETAR